MATVLLVEDNANELKAYQLHIQDSGVGWKLLTATNEHEAAKIIQEQQIDAVVTDLLMINEESGLQVLRAAKAKDPFLMVLLVTAHGEKLDRYQAFEVGAFDCIPKSAPGVKTAQEILIKTQTAIRFRELALAEIENQRKVDFLRRYFDPKVFTLIEKKPELLTIQTRLVTIVFWDIRGFSRLCEILKAHPTLIAGFLREYCAVASQVIFRNHGVLDKFIGDGVMAVFGAVNGRDAEGKADAQNAVKAAIEFRDAYAQVQKKWLEQWILYTPQQIDIGLGCGIHTGESLVGNVGTEQRDQYTVLGPHVNFASRIEGRAARGQILCSTSTCARLGEGFETRSVEVVKDVKNIAGEFEIFEVVRERRI